MSILKIIEKEKFTVKVLDTREAMGALAAKEIGERISELQKQKEEINIIFAAAPSQNEVLENLIKNPDIDWTKINGFHMDEYIGLDPEAPQLFGNFLRERLFDKVPFRAVYYINGGAADIEKECERYTRLLEEHQIDIVCLGIGENGHIAFNDPDVAEFDDLKVIKRVKLDDVCRQQQVNDGCFRQLTDVPTEALTLTIPTLMGGQHLFCSVPSATKSKAVCATVNGTVTEMCPASILRTHDSVVMYCDKDSGCGIL